MIRTMVRGLCAGPALAALAVAAVAPARADDLESALAAAYATNPDLAAARASQRATDENVPIAQASGLPSLSGTTNYTEFLKQGPNSFIAPKRSFQVDTTLSVPIYAGGAVKNALLAAKTRVEAGQAGLRGTEAGVFSQVVAAYMDVIRDAATVGLPMEHQELGPGVHDEVDGAASARGVPDAKERATRGIHDGGFACCKVLGLHFPGEEDELGLDFEGASDSSGEGVDGGGCHSRVD
jgi:hypothetical protein